MFRSALFILLSIAIPINAVTGLNNFPLRCQDKTGNLLLSAIDCEDDDQRCPLFFKENGTDVRPAACNKHVLREGALMCAKTCRICCEKPHPVIPETFNLDDGEVVKQPHCEYRNGTLVESATTCEDKYDAACKDMFNSILTIGNRPHRCHLSQLRYFAVMWCPKLCSMCCEVPSDKSD